MVKTFSIIQTLLVLGLIAFQGALAQPASKFIVTAEAVNDFKNWYLPQVIAQFQGFTLPAVDGGENFAWTVNNIVVKTLRVDIAHTGVAMTPGNLRVFSSGIDVEVDFNATGTARTQFFGLASTWHDLASLNGQGKASTSGATFSVPFKLVQNPKTGILSVVLSDIQFNLGTINVQLSGNLAVRMLGDVINLFNNQLKGIIESKLKEFLMTALPTQLNELLKQQQMTLDIPDTQFGVNYYPSQAPQVFSNRIELYSNSFFYLAPNSNVRPNIAAPKPLPTDVDSEAISLIFMDYFLNSVGYAEFQAGVLTYDVAGQDLHTPLGDFNVQEFSPFFPALAKHFDKKTPVDLVLRPTAPPTITTNGVMNVTVAAEIDINVRGPTENTTLVTIVTTLSATVNPKVIQEDVLALQISVDDINMGGLKLVNGKLGSFTMPEKILKILVTAALKLIKPMINNKLAENTIPITTIPGVSFSNLHIVCGNGYIKVLADPIFRGAVSSIIV